MASNLFTFMVNLILYFCHEYRLVDILVRYGLDYI